MQLEGSMSAYVAVTDWLDGASIEDPADPTSCHPSSSRAPLCIFWRPSKALILGLRHNRVDFRISSTFVSECSLCWASV